MSTIHRRAHRRGYSLIELATALALTTLLAALAMPHFVHAKRAGELRRTCQRLVADVGTARVLAASGERPGAPWGAEDRVESAGLMVFDATSYYLFIDRDRALNGDEVVVRTIVLPPGMRIRSPAAGQVMRFRPNGTIAGVFDVEVEDQETQLARTVVVAAGGYARVN